MLFQYVGDPVTNLLGQDATQEQRIQLRTTSASISPFHCSFRVSLAASGREVPYEIKPRRPGDIAASLALKRSRSSATMPARPAWHARRTAIPACGGAGGHRPPYSA